MSTRHFLLSLASAILALVIALPAHAQLPQDGLVAHWNFDGFQNGAPPFVNRANSNSALNGSLLRSSSGTSETSSLPALFSNDIPPEIAAGQSFVPNGASQEHYVRVDNPVLDNYDADYTVAAWFRADDAPAGATRYAVYESQGFVLSLGLREDTTNTANTLIQFFTNIPFTGSPPRVDVSMPDSAIAEQWIHAALVFTRDGEERTMTAYINGVESGSTSFEEDLNLTPNPDFFHIGSHRLGTPDTRFFQGRIDDVAIWERALTFQEIGFIARPSLDVNGDGIISIGDLIEVEIAALQAAPDLAKDLNNDGAVDDIDVQIITSFLEETGLQSETVTTLADDGPGSLRNILGNATTSGTLITFAPNTSGGTITLNGNQLEVPEGIEVIIDGGDADITIDANQQSRVMRVNANATVALHGLTFTGGRTNDGGGLGDFGGDGGGIFVDNNSSLTLSSCTISGNQTGNGRFGGNGGGIFADDNSTLTLSSCTISGNQTGGFGGDGGDGGFGGGIFAAFDSTLTLSSCTISGNQTGNGDFGGLGGGIFAAFDSTLTLSSCTISGNQTGIGGIGGIGGNGGGLRLQNSASVTINNSIIAGNSGSSDSDQINGTIDAGTGNLTSGDPLLAPLANYGGPTQTMHPLAGSPAILTGSTTRSDQRGFTLTGPPTIGAVQVGRITVVSDETLLRGALGDPANQDGGVIRFASALNGETITLSGTQLVVPGTANGLFIDASSLSNGLTIDASQQSRVMLVSANATVALHGLTLTGGNATGSFPDNVGGAIFANGSEQGNSVSLSLSQCTLSGNSAGFGGGIASDGVSGGSVNLNLSACTLSDNFAENNGGGIFSQSFNFGNSSLSLSGCTFSGNSARFGGGIFNNGSNQGNASLDLSACTLSGNLARFGGGGGIFNDGSSQGSASLSLNNSILAGNTAPTNPDLENSGSPVNGTNNLFDPTLPSDPQLAPLGYYGGPTMTMHPLAGSPAILTGSTTRTDQRGFTLTGPPTIGAVQVGRIIPVSNEDTLRQALADSANQNGDVIRFVSQGQTITLTNGQLVVPGTANGLFIDASSLTNGLTIDANQESRVMLVNANATVALHGLTFTGGRTNDGVNNGFNGENAENGGGIFADNNSTLTLSSCTISGNQTGNGGNGISRDGISNFGGDGGLGGGIFADNDSSLTLSSCTISGNQTGNGGDGGLGFEGGSGGDGGFGGGIFANFDSTLTLSACTISGNQTGNGGDNGSGGLGGSDGGLGGGIFANNNSTLTLSACTISGNQTGDGDGGGGGGFGGGIFAINNSTLTLSSCTISENQAASGSGLFLRDSASVTINNSIIAGNSGTQNSGTQNSGTIDAGTGNLISDDPQLAPLDNYGGPTMTMPPLPGSPAIDAAGSSNPGGTDQRGFTRFIGGSLDIGAVEFQGLAEEVFNGFQLDFDSDGSSNGVELAIGTDPFVADPSNERNLRLNSIAPNGSPQFTFGVDDDQQANIILRLTRSTDLITFDEVLRSNENSDFENPGNTPLSIEDPNPPADGRVFYRLEAELR